MILIQKIILQNYKQLNSTIRVDLPVCILLLMFDMKPLSAEIQTQEGFGKPI
jgi:hypothetical protein